MSYFFCLAITLALLCDTRTKKHQKLIGLIQELSDVLLKLSTNVNVGLIKEGSCAEHSNFVGPPRYLLLSGLQRQAFDSAARTSLFRLPWPNSK